MKIFKVYKWDCIISWILGGLSLLDVAIMRNGDFLFTQGVIYYFYYLIPVHLVLWLIALISSIKNKQVSSITFCAVSPLISIIALFFIILFFATSRF